MNERKEQIMHGITPGLFVFIFYVISDISLTYILRIESPAVRQAYTLALLLAIIMLSLMAGKWHASRDEPGT